MSLKAWYKFDDNGNDSIGKNNLTHTASGSYASGKIGKSFIGNGTSGSISMQPSKSGMNFNNNVWSISLWVKPNFTAWTTVADRYSILDIGSYYTLGETDIYLSKQGTLTTDRTIYLGVYSNQVGIGTTTQTFTDAELGDWIFFSISSDGTKLYMNSFCVQSNTWRNTNVTVAWVNTTYPIRDNLYLGGYGWATNNWRGNIDDVKVYDNVLSTKEMKELAKAKVLHYTFNDFQEPTTNLYNTCSRNFPENLNYPVQPPVEPNNGFGWDSIQWNGDIQLPNTFNSGDVLTVSGYYMAYSTDTLITLNATMGIHMWSSRGSEGVVVDTPIGWNQWQYFEFTKTFDGTATSVRIEDRGFDYYNPTHESFTKGFWCNVQFELKNHATPFTPTSRGGIIRDCSGYKNDSILTEYITPKWIEDNKLGGGAYYFNGINDRLDIGNLGGLSGFTGCSLSFWRKNDIANANWLPFVGQDGNYYIMATSNGTGNFYHNNIGTSWKIYCDGVNYNQAAPPFTDQLWHHYVITGVNLSTWTNLKFSGYGGVWNVEGYLDDLRIYNNVLSDADVLELYQTRAALDSTGNLFINEIFERDNLINPINDAVIAKQFINGLSSYQQTNCICTLNNTGYNVYRTPNLLYPTDGTVMWGGIVLHIPEGTFIVGRKYVFRIKYNGVSSSGISDIYFGYVVGWTSMGGLSEANIITSITSDSNRFSSINTNEKWENLSINITPIYSELYKNATITQGGVISGQTYYCANQFKIGHTYDNTGALGTNLTYKDFRLFDITDDNEKEIALQDTGTFVLDKISEVGITDGLVGWWKLNGDARDYSGNSYHGTVNGAVVSSGLKDKAYYFNNNYIDLPDYVGYTTEVSAFAWFQKIGSPGGGYHIIFGGGGLEISSNAGEARIGIYTSDGRFVDNFGSGLTDGNWHSVGFTFSNGTKISYIDGVSVGTNSTITGTLTNSFSTRRIGMYGADTTYYANGKITDARIYNRALSTEEVLILYKQGSLLTGMQLSSDGCLYLNKEIIEGF